MNSDWFNRVCMSSLGHRTSQEATYDIARLALERGVPGDFVECGVYAGASCALMARAIMDHSTSWGRKVHLFDSFAGIPAPGEYDTSLAANRGGESACSIEGVKINMEAWGIPDELLVYHQGLFADTVPLAVEYSKRRTLEAIAVLRLDGDLYESTRVPLQHLYPIVSRGGWVIVDDYDLAGARKAVEDHFATAPAPIMWRKP